MSTSSHHRSTYPGADTDVVFQKMWQELTDKRVTPSTEGVVQDSAVGTGTSSGFVVVGSRLDPLTVLGRYYNLICDEGATSCESRCFLDDLNTEFQDVYGIRTTGVVECALAFYMQTGFPWGKGTTSDDW
eukprot:TRINITY_DN87096_c0_g1_i1.p1 TRINITY_DN87096_c0_g1~~TRINITY_DN87096_c0_g1_i1.p1  ORF type:complete len:130 (-),score=20.39 TRINITY_DN87096_c0_g1_i1:123-512(-)